MLVKKTTFPESLVNTTIDLSNQLILNDIDGIIGDNNSYRMVISILQKRKL